MIATGLTSIGIGVILFAALRHIPVSDTHGLIVSWLAILLLGAGAILLGDTMRYRPLPERAAAAVAAAPIAGAPLVRVHDLPWPRVARAHALLAEPAQRRLPFADEGEVLP